MASTQVYPLRGTPSVTEAIADAGGQELVRRARAGDLRGFEELVKESQSAVTAVVARILNGRDDVDDVIQEVYISAFQHLDSFRGEARFSTWIHRIAVNTALKRLKQIQRKTGISLDDPENALSECLESDPAEAPLDMLLQRERQDAIRKAVASLPEKHRIVITLRYFDDYSCDEIASMLGCSVGTVWSRLHYACKQLKKSLEWIRE